MLRCTQTTPIPTRRRSPPALDRRRSDSRLPLHAPREAPRPGRRIRQRRNSGADGTGAEPARVRPRRRSILTPRRAPARAARTGAAAVARGAAEGSACLPRPARSPLVYRGPLVPRSRTKVRLSFRTRPSIRAARSPRARPPARAGLPAPPAPPAPPPRAGPPAGRDPTRRAGPLARATRVLRAAPRGSVQSSPRVVLPRRVVRWRAGGAAAGCPRVGRLRSHSVAATPRGNGAAGREAATSGANRCSRSLGRWRGRAWSCATG